jgi:carboxyl-terminal processing protease
MGVLRMLDEFLEKGEPILYTEGLNQPRKSYNASGKNTWKDMKVYVVIDEFLLRNIQHPSNWYLSFFDYVGR